MTPTRSRQPRRPRIVRAGEGGAASRPFAGVARETGGAGGPAGLGHDFGAVRVHSGRGLPESLRAGIERLSGLPMDDVRLHLNSPKPAQLGAAAYTQGTEIHVGPGQESHLPHEAWHVVQQKQGRVRATMSLKGKPVNDDRGLERDAEVMGSRAMGLAAGAGHDRGCGCATCGGAAAERAAGPVQRAPVIQRQCYLCGSPSCRNQQCLLSFKGNKPGSGPGGYKSKSTPHHTPKSSQQAKKWKKYSKSGKKGS